MKRRLLRIALTLAVTLAVISAAACESELPGGSVAQVGDVYIGVEEFERIVELEASAMGLSKESAGGYYEREYRRLQQSILEQLVANEVVDQAADELEISVSEEEVQAELDDLVQYYYEGDLAALEQEAADNGMTLEELEENIQDGLLRDKVRAEVVADVTVSDDEIQDYYEEHLDDYYVQPSRQIRHILVKPGVQDASDSLTASVAAAAVTEADWQDALDTAHEVRRKLVSGASWTEIAATYSDDFATKDSGGDMGTVYLGQTVKEFEDVAFALGLDDISQPVKTVYGYHIIQVTAITTGGTQPLDEVKAMIEYTLLSQAQQEAFDQWLEDKTAALGVVYRSDLRPATTTTESTTTTEPDSTTSTEPGSTTTASSPTDE